MYILDIMMGDQYALVMRTTITIHDDLLRQAKQAALEQNCTLGAIVEDALRKALLAKGATRRKQNTKLITQKGDGVQPGVDLDNTSDLVDLMEGQ